MSNRNQQRRPHPGWLAAGLAAAAAAVGVAVHQATQPRPSPPSVVPQALTGQQAAQALRGLKNGQTLVLTGEIPGPIDIEGKNGWTLIGPATIRGGKHALEIGGCRDFVERQITVTGAQDTGCWVHDSKNGTWEKCHFDRNTRSGWVSGSLHGFKLTDCTADLNVNEHGLYASDGSTDGTFLRCSGTNNGLNAKNVKPGRGVTFQNNGVDSGQAVSRVTWQDCVSRGAGDGTGMSVKGANGITIINFDDDSREASIAVSGEGVGARNVKIQGTGKLKAPQKVRVGNGAPQPQISG